MPLQSCQEGHAMDMYTPPIRMLKQMLRWTLIPLAIILVALFIYRSVH